MRGVELTERWIEEHDIRDTSGVRHHPHGIWTCEARLICYVLFDSNPKIGRRVFYFFTEHMQVAVKDCYDRKYKPVYGSRGGLEVGQTGAGYKIEPMTCRIDRIEPIRYDGERDDSEMAVTIVASQLKRREGMGALRPATRDEQYMGIDIVANDPVRRYGVEWLSVEVKSRPRQMSQPFIFLQVSETNAARIFR